MPPPASCVPPGDRVRRMTRVNLVAFENGVGNSRDIALLAAALRAQGCSVTVTVPSKHARRRRRLRLVRALGDLRRRLAARQFARGRVPAFDVTVMLEHVWPEELHRARRNVIVPNPEFFDRHDQSLLDAFDAVWAKTRNTFALFSQMGRRCSLIGFDSVDRDDPGVTRRATFLHLAGRSRMKGTAPLLELWARHPEWPLLTVVQSLPRPGLARIPNVRIETRFLSDDELRRLQNENQFHLCTSETEGWGHYIAEAASTGAVAITTDAPPMNELITAARGLLVRAAPRGRQHLATTFAFDPLDLERVVAVVSGMGPEERTRLSRAAREWFAANKAGFGARLAAALAELSAI